MKRIETLLFWVCPKTGRITGLRPLKKQAVWLYPLIGLAALIWFLVRVVPKPSRASYPCQRAAMPLALGFVAWVLGSSASTMVLRKLKLPFVMRRVINVALAIIVGVGLLGGGSADASNITLLAYTPHPANSPIGTARGLMPGRVAWAHDTLVTDWNGTASNASQSWFNHTSQSEATQLMRWAIMGYAGTTTIPAAWEAIFRHFNGGSTSYQSGEKIFIKVNMTTSSADTCADANYNWTPSGCGVTWSSIGESPQLMIALLDQLVNAVGVAQSDITIGDSDCLWINELYNPVHGAFPNVKYLDARGTLGRTKAVRSTTRLYWSTTEANGKNPDFLLQAIVDAKYMINLAVLKTHGRAGITVTAKNHFGSFSGGNDDIRHPDTPSYYNLHLRLPLNADTGSWPQRASMAQYRPVADLNGDTGMGGMTLLYMIDGIFGGKDWSGAPSKWAMAPFNNNWPSSLFLSMDQVAIDSVAFDFLSQKWPEHALANEGVQDYLHEMALADNPPSGTFYDPENDGIRMASLGVHEHWNNAVGKQYSRNLGTGSGIELIYIDSDPSVILYTLTANNDGHGTVSLNPTGGTYASGTTVTLTPVPSSGYQFGSWSGANAGDVINTSGVYTILMNGNKTVQVNFTQITYTLTANNDGHGTVTLNPTGGTYVSGTTVTLTPAPNSGYQFGSWSGANAGDVINTSGIYTILMNGNKTVQANFTLSTQVLTVSRSSTGSGTVTSVPPGIDCGGTCSASFSYNTSVTLTAAALTGSTFTGWSGACTGSLSTCTLLMNSARSATAIFTLNTDLTHAISLASGWNLVSFNVHPSSPVVADVLATITGGYSLVFAWDTSVSGGRWLKYDPTGPVYANSLTNLDEKMGFWIRMTAPATLTVSGSAPSDDIALVSGWNLVGYPSRTSLPLPEALTGHGVSDLLLVYAYHAAESDLWKVFDSNAPAWSNDLNELSPDWGYWIKLGGAHTWEVIY